MKKSILLLILLVAVSATTTFAQRKKKRKDQDRELTETLMKIFKTEVDMDVDSTIFNAHEDNMYASKQYKAWLMTLVAPQSIDKAGEKFDEPNEKEGYTLIEKKKLEHDGRVIFYEKGEVVKDGQKAIMYVYQIEASPESTIFLTATIMEGDNEVVAKAIERAAFTAKLAGK